MVDPKIWLQYQRAAGKEREALREYLVLRHMECTKRLAWLFYSKSARRVPFEDICQEAFIVLVQSVDRFDPSLGFKFTTYLRGQLALYLKRVSSALTGTRSVDDVILKVSRFIRKYELMNQSEPDLETISNEIDERPEAVLMALSLLNGERQSARVDDVQAELELVPSLAPNPQDEVLASDLSVRIWSMAQQQLSKDDVKLLHLRYVEGYSGPEIARFFGISPAAVRKRHERALERLRSAFSADGT